MVDRFLAFASLYILCVSSAWAVDGGAWGTYLDGLQDHITQNRFFNKVIEFPDSYYNRERFEFPYLSHTNTSPSVADYDVFGVSGETLYGYLDITGTYDQSSILFRDSFQRDQISTVGSLSDARRFLGGKNESVLVNGITGSNNYNEGDYIVSAYAKLDGLSRYSHPIKFSVLNQGSLIVDNDQQNANNDFTDDPSGDVFYSGDEGDKAPGYYLTSDIHSGQSDAMARWKLNYFGTAELYVYVPEAGSTATNVVYKISPYGSSDLFSQPVDHSTNAGSWVKLTSGTQDTFSFGRDGFVEIYLGSASSDYNNSIPSTERVGFDALKVNSLTDQLCHDQIQINETKTGSYISQCPSAHRSSRYATYYTFVLTEISDVVIDLDSSVDTYLYLLDGPDMDGSVIASDDDGGPGYDSKLTMTLDPGIYTIEATTYGTNKTGSVDVTLTVEGGLVVTVPCHSPIALGDSVTGVWIDSCNSTHRTGRYANYYTFTLTQLAIVTIDLKSSVDTYLYLLSGSDENGSVIASNDDGGQGYNSKITKLLTAGDYTIEATTYSSGRTGSYELILQ